MSSENRRKNIPSETSESESLGKSGKGMSEVESPKKGVSRQPSQSIEGSFNKLLGSTNNLEEETPTKLVSKQKKKSIFHQNDGEESPASISIKDQASNLNCKQDSSDSGSLESSKSSQKKK